MLTHKLKLGLHPKGVVVAAPPDGLADLITPWNVVLIDVSSRSKMTDAIHRPNDGINLGISSTGGVEITVGLLAVFGVAEMSNLVDDRILVDCNVLVRGIGDGIAQVQNDIGGTSVMEDGQIDVVAAVGMKDGILLLITLEQTDRKSVV